MRSARVLLTLPAAFTAVVPAIADLNPSHLANDAWPPHARFHGAAFVAVNVVLGLCALWLIWRHRGTVDEPLRLRIAALLPAVLWGSMLPALLAPGASSWPDGMDRIATLPFAPQIVIALLLVALCGAGAWRARARLASDEAA